MSNEKWREFFASVWDMAQGYPSGAGLPDHASALVQVRVPKAQFIEAALVKLQEGEALDAAFATKDYDAQRKLWRFVEVHGVRHIEAPSPCSLVDFFDAADALREAFGVRDAAPPKEG